MKCCLTSLHTMKASLIDFESPIDARLTALLRVARSMLYRSSLLPRTVACWYPESQLK